MLALSSFTVWISITMGAVATQFHTGGQGDIVIMAWGSGMGIFGGLSVYTYVNPFKHEFASWGTGLFCALWGMILWGIFICIFGTGFIAYKVYCLFGIFLFMGYICYDTHRLLEVYGPGDEYIAAVELYLDVINLILYIMSFFGDR